MFYGTSNLWDRSYTKGDDIELSILLTGPKVRNIEKKIYNNYEAKIERIYLSKNIIIDSSQTTHIIKYIILIILALLIIIFFIYIVLKNIHHIKKILYLFY